MKNLLNSLFIIFLLTACKSSNSTLTTKKSIFVQDNLLAWCVVPFDKQKRNAVERAKMLKELGFNRFVWDWRAEHLPLLEEEIRVLEKNKIELTGVWFWIDGGNGKQIDYANESILQTLEKTKTKTTLWISFPAKYFKDLSEKERMEKGVKTIQYVYNKASAIGCKIALYNHGDWFGEPESMVKLIRASGHTDIGIIYNFHHAHPMLDDYEKDLKLMMPYLQTVNLNGMKVGGDKILPIGKGDVEFRMMKTLEESGFNGKIGILGHVNDRDVKEVLKENLQGLHTYLNKEN